MAEHPINELMSTVLSKIKEMVDVNTIVGDTIITSDGTTIIPVSKVSFGFASGGCDLPKQTPTANSNNLFGGGSGAGVSVMPVAFLVVSNGFVKLLPVSGSTTTLDRIIDNIPDTIEKVNGIIKEYRNNDSYSE